MKILIIGKNGQVGHELHQLLDPRLPPPEVSDPTVPRVASYGRTGFVPYSALTVLDYPDIDLADPDSIIKTIRHHNPDILVNAAAYTAVDQAEEEESKAHAINAAAPGIMAEEMKKRRGALIHYSTDYVFDGTGETPYTEEDEPNPLSAYGRTKLAGEQAIAASGIPHIILRTSWIYGTRGRNFLLTILKLAHEREELRIVNDQHGAPTWSRDLARATTKILSLPLIRAHSGLYHLTNQGHTTWHGFAEAIIEHDPKRAGQSLKTLTPIPTTDYPTPAPRPENSRLDCTRAKAILNLELPPWDESLQSVMQQLKDPSP